MTRTYSTEDLDHSVYKPLIQTATIANGATTSSAIDLGGAHLFALEMPASFTGATLTIQVSADNSTYQALYDQDGNQVTITVAQSHTIYLDPIILSAFRYIKLVSGSAEGGDRTINLFTRTV